MAVTAFIYGNALIHFLDADIDWTADTIKTALTTSSETPDQDADDFWDDAEANEVSGTGYSAGGATLANPARTYTAGTNVLKLDADDRDWTSASFTARNAHVYKDRGGATSADELISYVDFGGNETVASGTFTIQWHANGIITITAS
jgi:hypothetical protein